MNLTTFTIRIMFRIFKNQSVIHFDYQERAWFHLSSS